MITPKRLRAAGAALMLALLTAGWLYLYFNSRAVDSNRQAAMLDRIKDLSRLDAEWSADVLRSDADINRTYDPLTRPIPVMNRVLGELDAEAARLGDPDIKRAVDALWLSFDAKTALIDRFKAQNSLLKNSLRYTPTANAEILGLMRAQRDAGLAEGSRLVRDVPGALDGLEKAIRNAGAAGEGLEDASVSRALAALRITVSRSRQAEAATRGAMSYMNLEGEVSALIGDTMRFAAAPEPGAAEHLKAGADRLEAMAAEQTPAVREAVRNLMLHVNAVRTLRISQRDLLADVSRLPMAANLDALTSAFTRRFDAELAGQTRFNRLLLAYSAIALLLVFTAVAVIVWRQLTERRRLEALVQQQTRELRENEAQLVHAQKMSALGETVAGIAHEINTPLAAVKSGLQSTRDLLEPVREYVSESGALVSILATPAPRDDAARAARNADLGTRVRRIGELHDELESVGAIEALDELSAQSVTSIEHIHQVVVNMLDYSRVDRARVATIQIEEAIERTLLMAGHILKGIQLTKRYQRTHPVAVDVAQINQVILNLVKNAAQAVPAGRGEIRLETTMQGEANVVLRVVDNGAGIPRDLLPKIWEPFFTTKKSGAGTGLGLSTSKRIVDAHQGRIEVDSTVGKGTVFTIVLPAAGVKGSSAKPVQKAHVVPA